MQPSMPMMPVPQASMPHSPQRVTTSSNWRTRLISLILLVLVAALVGGSIYWLQWASQRGITLGYPNPTVHISSSVSTSVTPGTSIQFSAVGTGRNLTYTWDFGDQSGGVGSVVSHTYQNSGSFTVTVTITDVLGRTNIDSTTVHVAPPLPTASFTAIEQSGFSGSNQTVNFDASASSAGAGTMIDHYTWNFGDNSSPETDAGAFTSHYYSSTPAQYTVTLTVYDATGQASPQVTQTIYVQ